MDSALRRAEPDASVTPHRPSEFVALEHRLQPIRRHLAGDITELCINRPGEFWTESSKGWERHEDPELNYENLAYLATLCANSTKQKISQEHPILSAALHTGERVQLVIPPATSSGCVSVTIRKPGAARFSMDQYQQSGFFDHVVSGRTGLLEHEVELQALLKERRLRDFFSLAVRTKQTIVVSGATGSGKTTFMKALVDLIPHEERLITIEDTPELTLVQPNHVRLFYAKGGQSVSKVTAGELVESSMRMKPDRILPAEVRDEAAYYFIEAANTGHPGSITSVHANSERLAFGRLKTLARKADEAANMTDEALRELLLSTIDIVVQVGKAGSLRAITGIYYEPGHKHAAVG